MNKARLAIAPAAAVAAAALAAAMQFASAETKTLDDLQGLRPDTQGVQTNAFWDTRAHLTYTVQSSLGTSTNAIDTAFLTIDVSEPATVGGESSTVICFR